MSAVVLIGLWLTATASFAMRATDQAGDFDAGLLRIDEAAYLGKAVPDVTVTTEAGARRLAELIAGRPTIVLLAYYGCGHSCPVTMRNLQATDVGAASEDYRVLVLSFDVRDTVDSLRAARGSLGEIPDNWIFGLLGEDEGRRLTESVGFRFFYSERDQVFVHPAVLVFLSPEGEVMRYLFGAEPRARDVELALVESRNRTPRLGEVVDMLMLSCFQFDATRSRYVLHPTVIFGGAGLGVLGLVGVAVFASRKNSLGDT